MKRVNGHSKKPSKPGSPSAIKQAAFLAYIGKLPCIEHACEAVGVSKQQIYRLRRAKPEFRKKWDAAIRRSIEAVEKVAFEMALAGDEKLIRLLLRAHKPKKYNPVTKTENLHGGMAGKPFEIIKVAVDTRQEAGDYLRMKDIQRVNGHAIHAKAIRN